MDFKFPTLWDHKKSKKDDFLSKEEKHKMIENCLNSGKITGPGFGSELLPIFLNRIDYEGFIREIFKTHQTSSSNVVFTINIEEEDEFSKTRKALQEVRDILDKRT